MINRIFRLMTLSIMVSTLPSMSFASTSTAACKDTYNTTIVKSDRLIDSGDSVKALAYLNNAIKCYPNRDVLLMRRGRIHYKLSDMDNSEKDFMGALKLNIDNDTAFAFTEKIRVRQAHMETKKAQRLSSVIETVTVESLFTIASIAIGFAFGSLIKLGWVERKLGLRKAKMLINTFDKQDHMEIGLFLERHISKLNYIIIDSFMRGLVKSTPYSDIELFLNKNIYNDDNRNILYRMLENHKIDIKS